MFYMETTKIDAFTDYFLVILTFRSKQIYNCHMNENLNNQANEQAHNYLPQAHAQIEPRFENYTEKTDYFFNIDKQIDDKERELTAAARESMENPIASKESYTKLMSVIKNDIEELRLKKERMTHSKETIH
ncbi:MAG TPA: hypothetical protein DDX26_00700 [Candidatus Yonathbacteria bacterium]|nr:hypothetical protein [Candidatus Yonathbacteria bacterium]